MMHSTPEALKSVKIVDSHVHLSQWYEHGQNFIDSLRAYREENSLEALGVVCIPYMGQKVKRDVSQNIMAAILKWEDRNIYAFGGLIYPTEPVSLPFPEALRPERQAQMMLDAGFDGIKMLEGKPNVRRFLGLPLSSPAYDAYYALLERHCVHIIWHVADPAQFWDPNQVSQQVIDAGWYYGGGGFLSREALYAEILEVLRKFPLLKVTFAHFLFLEDDPEEAARVLDEYPNVCFDLTPHWRMYVSFTNKHDLWRDFFNKYADRLILGTDNVSGYDPERMKNQIDFVRRFIGTGDIMALAGVQGLQGLNLDPDVAEKICSKNFLNRCGLSPRTMDKMVLYDYISSMLPYVAAGELRDQIVRYVKEKLM